MRCLLAIVALVVALAVPASTSAVSGITVFAAASLTAVLPKIDPAPRYSFGGSDSLAFQIRSGAPADVYAAASPAQPEALYADGIVLKPRVFATNRLTVIVPHSNPARIRSVYDLRRSGTKLVIGEPKVPIGAYTRQVLANLGISDAVLKNVVSEETDVKGIVAKVALGQADAGFVYATDVRAVARQVLRVSIPTFAQPTVRYEIAVVKSSARRKAAQAFVARVLSTKGRATLLKSGFGVPKLRTKR
jgi:molybdate transport system substrate-binding protein